jgi:hypothetical protein
MPAVIIALIAAPFVILIIAIYVWGWRHTSDNKRPPLKDEDKLLRAPGEHLMEERGNIEEKVSYAICIVLVGPAAYIGYEAFMANGMQLNWLGIAVTYILVCLPALYYLLGQLTKLSNYRLGLRGERAVGEELNKLMLDGCHVYHDFKKDTDGNIDHIVVAPSGVYCVETKCSRKRKALPNRKEHEIVFDGEQLLYPHNTNSFGVDQTRRNSAQLAQWLSSAVGEKITVKGILTFPGWYVRESKMARNLRVLNPKLIRSYIGKQKEKILDAKLTKQIVHQLEQRCRNVEM